MCIHEHVGLADSQTTLCVCEIRYTDLSIILAQLKLSLSVATYMALPDCMHTNSMVANFLVPHEAAHLLINSV